MMLPERWLVAAVLGLALSLASMAGSVFGQRQNGAKSPSQSGTNASGQQAIPAKAVPDPNAPAPPDDPQAQPPKKDDDLAPEPDAGDGEDAQGVPDPKSAQTQNPGASQNGSGSNPPPAKAATEEVAPEVKSATSAAGKDVDSKAPTPQVAGSADATPKTQESKTQESGRHGKYDKETVQLLALVQGLKTDVEKAGSNTLSLAALRKADEIQKVAKELKEKMKEQGMTVASKP
jgi:hypothetical protein